MSKVSVSVCVCVCVDSDFLGIGEVLLKRFVELPERRALLVGVIKLFWELGVLYVCLCGVLINVCGCPQNPSKHSIHTTNVRSISKRKKAPKYCYRTQ